MIKYSSKTIVVLILFLITGMVSIGWAEAAVDTPTKSAKAVVFLFDVSQSMEDSDPQGAAEETARLLIDVYLELGDQASVMAYTDKIVMETPVEAITSEAGKLKLKAALPNSKKGKATDIGVALKNAVAQLEKHTLQGQQPMIFLFSDGCNDLKSTGRSSKQAEQEQQAALKAASQIGCRIYTVGFNADHSMNSKTLEMLATTTGGRFHPYQGMEAFTAFWAELSDANQEVTVLEASTARDIPVVKTRRSLKKQMLVFMVLIACALIFGVRWRYQTNIPLAGALLIEIFDDASNSPKAHDLLHLSGFRGVVTLKQLLQHLPDFEEGRYIIFSPGKHGRLCLRNNSRLLLQRDGKAMERGRRYELRSNERIAINLNGEDRIIHLEYLSETH